MPKSIDELLKEYEEQQDTSVGVESKAYASDDAFECCVLTCCLACVSM